MPSVTLPNRPVGLAGVYDVTDDWIPIYDKTSLAGYYVAIGTSGNQFKNAPVIGSLMHALIADWRDGGDHDVDSGVLDRTPDGRGHRPQSLLAAAPAQPRQLEHRPRLIRAGRIRWVGEL